SLLAALVLVVTFDATASAQNPGVQVRRLEAAALEAFHNLDVDQADALLARAQAAAQQPGVSDADRARVFVEQGVVAIGGHQDTVRGTQLFMRALELDRTVRIDPNLSTPETQSAFSLAQSRVASGARANVEPSGARANAAPNANVAPSA